jgi:hypothetical protein
MSENKSTSPAPPDEPNQSSDPGGNSHVKPAKLEERVLAVAAKADRGAQEDVIMMADGTMRTKDHVLVSKKGWQYGDSVLATTYRRLHRYYLRLTLKWPRWVPRAALALIVAIIIVNAAVLIRFVQTNTSPTAGGTPLPVTGLVQADGSKYLVKNANWQYVGALTGWTVENTKSVEGKSYSTLDGTCTVQVVRASLAGTTENLELLTKTAREKYLGSTTGLKAEVSLPTIQVAAVNGEQKYELIRNRFSYIDEKSQPQVSEVATRTLAGHTYHIVQTCRQDTWDQTQASRDNLVKSVRITAN